MYDQHKDSSPLQYFPKQQIAKLLCVICGDCASGKHYGTASCEGCKGFFKRTIRRELIYNCRDVGNCTIDRNERNRCKYCRFQKCLNSGMKREAVQEERRRSPQIIEVAVQPTAGIGDEFINLVQNLTMESMSKALQSKKSTNSYTFKEMPLLRVHTNSMIEPECKASVSHFCQIVNQELFQLITRVRQLPQFSRLVVEDQILLLKDSWLELLILQAAWYSVVDGAATITGNRKRISTANAALSRLYLNANFYYERADATKADLENLFIRILGNLCTKLQRYKVQLEEIACLQAIVLFKPDLRGLRDAAKIALCRDKMYACLHKHGCTKHSADYGRFENLLLRLPELRSISLKCLDQLMLYDIIGEMELEQMIAEEIRRN